MNQEEFDKGYADAIETIKKMLNSSNVRGPIVGDPINSDLPMPKINNDNGNSKGGDSDNENTTTSNGGDSDDENTTTITEEDTENMGGNSNDPGGMITKEEGDKIREAEGEDPLAGDDKTVEREWQEAAIKATSKFKGEDPGNVLSRIKDIRKTKTDWKKYLKKIIGHCISVDEDTEERFTDKRRLVTKGEYSRTDKLAEKEDSLSSVFVFIDSSGSMSDEQLRLCLSEVYTMAEQKKPIKLITVQCDTQITEIKEYKNLKSIKNDFKQATVKGRGGTNLKPCWDLLVYNKKYNKMTPTDLVMVFTDGYLDQYPRNKKTMKNLYWCILDNTNFVLENKDSHTFCTYFNTKDIK